MGNWTSVGLAMVLDGGIVDDWVGYVLRFIVIVVESTVSDLDDSDVASGEEGAGAGTVSAVDDYVWGDC